MRFQPLALAAFVSAALLGCGAGAGRPPADSPEVAPRERAADLFEAGREAAAHGDTVRAEQYLSAAIERGYDRGKALPLLLNACLSSSRLRAALAHAEPYLRDHPEDDALRYLVAIVHMGLGQTFAARMALEELIRRNERNVDAHLLLGILDSASEPSSAREHFRTYLEFAPHGERAPEARSRLAELSVLDTERLRVAAKSEPWMGSQRRDVATDDNNPLVPVTATGTWHDLPHTNRDSDDTHEDIRHEGRRP